MNWLRELELVELLREVMVSVDDRWEGKSILLDFVWIMVFLCGFSILIYFFDLYQLMKRKTMTETLIGMLLPGMAALSGAVLLTEYGSLPSEQVLAGLAERPLSMALSAQMTFCAVLFAVAFAVARLCLWEKKKGSLRWMASYAMDFLAAIMSFSAGVYGMLTNIAGRRGSYLFAGCGVLSGIFLYLLPLMLFKIVLILLLLLLRVIGARIRFFPYRQGMNPGAYLYGWQLLCRCPLLREVLVFSLVTGFFLIKTAREVSREDLMLAVPMFGCLAAGYLWAAVRHSTASLKKFGRWGDKKRLMEQFCREYFCEEPLFRDQEYTLTRNFLVEERNSAGIFYLGSLRYLPRGWGHDGKRWVREMVFSDGSKVTLEKGKLHTEEIFRVAGSYAKSYGIPESTAMADGIVNTHRAYMNTIKGQLLAVCTVVLMFCLTAVLLTGLGVWG